MSPETLAASVRSAMEATRRNVDAFLALPDDTPVEEALARFDRIAAPLDGESGRVGLFTQVHPDADVRTGCEELERELAALSTELSLHRGLFDRLERLVPGADAEAIVKRAFEHAVRDYRRSGVDRDEPTRQRVAALREELVQIGQDFDRNIITGGREFVIEEGAAGLLGLPDDFVAAHPPREDGAVVLTTDPSDRMSFLAYAERGDLRREYYKLCLNRAVPENLEVLPRLLAKRHELAGLLGYEHWADYVTEDKMTRSARAAREFVERVIELVRERAAVEYRELLEKKRQLEPGAESVTESERTYLTERIKQEKYGFDSQSVRPYFAFARVKAGVLETSAALFGVEFRRNEDVPVWHLSVECFDVVDEGDVVARFYLDMHARPDKYKHAAMFPLQTGADPDALPEGVLVCNFPGPKAGDPGLMLHEQVTTFFHEFGHLLHQLFAGKQRFLAFSGLSTEWDFVEVPSQMYEEWAWSPEVLQTFAWHVETDEPIPTEMVERMRAADEYGKALHVLQQMYYALLSLSYYDRDPSGLDPKRTMEELKAELLLVAPEEGTNFHASFGHLHGYSAMYYTYMWSLVIAKDLFERFEPDLMNTDLARAYRDKVLARGGSVDAAEMVRDFLGRDYDFGAFERWLAR